MCRFEILKRHLPFSGQEGLQELKKIAVRFEEKIFSAAESQLTEQRLKNSIFLHRVVACCFDYGVMDTNSWRPTQGGDLLVDAVDWRAQLLPDWQQRLVNSIIERLKINLPFSAQEGQEHIKKIAAKFEENIFTVATSQSDYLGKIASKMLLLEAKSPCTIATSSLANPEPEHDEPMVGASNWRALLLPDSRKIIVHKIMETLKAHVPFSGQEELQKLNKIAVRFEEKVFTTATSQSDYLGKISLKMLTMVKIYQNRTGNSSSISLANNIKYPTDPKDANLNIHRDC